MQNKLSNNICRLPPELQSHILSYSYSPQSPELLKDICDFSQSLSYANDLYYKKYVIEMGEPEEEPENWFLNDLFLCIYSCFIPRINRIYLLNRAFMSSTWTDMQIEDYIPILENKCARTQIRIIWGLLSPLERENVLCLGLHVNDLHNMSDDEEDFDY